MGFLDTLFGGGAEKEAAEQNRALLGQYQRGAWNTLDDGINRSTEVLNTGYDRATGAYQPLANKYGAATTLGLDALGVNGAAGNQRAVDAFQAGPGYQFALDQGNQAVERRRATSGMWDSGNTDIDLMKFGQGLANQEYGNWRNALTGFVPAELQATGGVANAAVGRGTGLADLYTRDADARTNVLGSVTSGGMQANNQEAAGKAAGAKNLLGAGLSLGSLVAGGLGGGGFGLGSLANMGSQMFGNGTGYQTNPWSSGGIFGAGGSGWT